MVEEQPSVPGKESLSPIRYPESKIFLDASLTLERVRFAVSELNSAGLSNLSLFQKDSVGENDQNMGENWWIKNDAVTVSAEAGYSAGFGPIYFVEELVQSTASRIAQNEKHTSSEENQNQFENEVRRSLGAQIVNFRDNPEVYHTFLGFLESDSRESGDRLVSAIKRKNEHVYDLARFPLLADYMVQSHEHYPEFTDVILHSTSKEGHALLYNEILKRFASLTKKRPSMLSLQLFSHTLVDPLIDAAEGSEEFTPNPFAELNLSKLYGDLFGLHGIFSEHKWLSFEVVVPDYLDKLKTRMLQASMRSSNEQLQKIAKEYFVDYRNTLAAQMLLITTVGDDAHKGKEKNNRYKEFIDLAFKKDSLMSERLKQYFGEYGTRTDLNQVFGGVIDFANIHMKFGRIFPEDALQVVLQCLKYFKPETQEDIDFLHELIRRQQAGIIVSKCRSLIEKIE